MSERKLTVYPWRVVRWITFNILAWLAVFVAAEVAGYKTSGWTFPFFIMFCHLVFCFADGAQEYFNERASVTTRER